jgi:hypothetical protein
MSREVTILAYMFAGLLLMQAIVVTRLQSRVHRQKEEIGALKLVVAAIMKVDGIPEKLQCLANTRDLTDEEAMSKPYETFIDHGVEWRVLHTDDQGNQFIITKHVHLRGTSYHSENEYVPLTKSDSLKLALDDWWSKNLSDDLKGRTLNACGVGRDVRHNPTDGWDKFWNKDRYENGSDGKTYPGDSRSADDIFILSISEVNEYFADSADRCATAPGDMNAQNAFWLLRSPGVNSGAPVACVTSGGVVGRANATGTGLGVRPALWIAPGILESDPCPSKDRRRIHE